ncbi:MAG: hypothetical protein M8364_16700 [Methylobacter sp.]|uniref:hypothetical protein n=1 Tax=Methylobacter sp. TaxID=2051955 RepID=UPI00258679B2|nr:hypothetical protein [Methylobacter sp.]MCL7422532.1 hypothetical protein [Methylobacter sp.]
MKNPTLDRVSQVAEKLLAMGFTVVTARFGPAPSITVKANHATQQLESHYKGQGFDGGRHYRTFVAIVDGVQVEWHKPHAVPATDRPRARHPWRPRLAH